MNKKELLKIIDDMEFLSNKLYGSDSKTHDSIKREFENLKEDFKKKNNEAVPEYVIRKRFAIIDLGVERYDKSMIYEATSVLKDFVDKLSE